MSDCRDKADELLGGAEVVFQAEYVDLLDVVEKLISVVEAARRLVSSPGAQYGDPETRDARADMLTALTRLDVR